MIRAVQIAGDMAHAQARLNGLYAAQRSPVVQGSAALQRQRLAAELNQRAEVLRCAALLARIPAANDGDSNTNTTGAGLRLV